MTKDKITDKEYLSKRASISKTYGISDLWSIVDHWPLYCGIKNLGRFVAIYELFKTTINVPGHIAEFGCWKGANLMFLAKILRLSDPFGNKLVHGFESFQGLTDFVSEDGEADANTGEYKGELKQLKDMIKLYNMEQDVIVHEGPIQETLPQFVLNNQTIRFSFVYCDTDLYEPTKIIMETVDERVSKGGLVVFDQWNDIRWPGETLAVNEFMNQYGEKYDMLHVPNTSQPTLALKKIAI